MTIKAYKIIKPKYIEYVSYPYEWSFSMLKDAGLLTLNIQEKAIAITQALGLTYSAIDMVLDRNKNFVFLECNPNGQWAWIETRLGYPISATIVDLLQNGE